MPRVLGDGVRKGELLAVIESREAADLKAEQLAAAKRLELARATFERERQLWEEKITAEQGYLLARQALAEAQIAHDTASHKLSALGISRTGSALARYEIRAPMSGQIIEKRVAPGEAVQQDAALFALADLTTVRASIDLYPKHLELVKRGQQVTVDPMLLRWTPSGRSNTSERCWVKRAVPQRRTSNCRTPRGTGDQGCSSRPRSAHGSIQVPVAVPAEAVHELDDAKVVFVREGERVEARSIKIGRSDRHYVEIAAGLSAGERCATTNSFILKAELGKGEARHDH